MEIHTFRAASLQEALMLVRHELGPEASVIQTRELSGRFFGLLGKRSIEVQASRDAKVMRRLPSITPNAAEDSKASISSARSSVGSAAQSLGELAAEAARTSSSQWDPADSSLEGDSATNRYSDARPKSHPSQSRSGGRSSASTGPISPGHASPGQLSPALFEVFTELLDADVEPEDARMMIQEVCSQCPPEQLTDAWMIKGRLCQWIQQRVKVSGPIDLASGERQVVALIGPTGVGKTTTLAKLAAGFHFDQGASVGFLTLDTFRLGAVDQLQKYADLLGVPCEVVSAPDQMRPAIERLSHCQLILIDTAGRSPRDAAQLDTLSDYLRLAETTQIHLVLSAASSQSHAEMALDQFASLQPTHLLLTKLDESTCLGNWYRLLTSDTWPLSYLTTGQHVPEDILIANRRRVASLIIGQTSHLTWK